jgi:outer membrane biogenesis lipoprotein LolB
MKKYLFIVAIAGLTACGPTAEEKAKMEQATQDSLKAVQDMQKAAEELAISQAQGADTTMVDSTTMSVETVK